MKLVSVYDVEEAPKVLYALLEERPWTAFISHERMPSYEQHVEFVKSNPFRCWYLMRIPVIDVETHCIGGYAYVGSIECTELNEIGVSVFKRHQRKGYAKSALQLFIATHAPLPPIPAKRNSCWLAHIAPTNLDGQRFFEKCGFRAIQETWCL